MFKFTTNHYDDDLREKYGKVTIIPHQCLNNVF